MKRDDIDGTRAVSAEGRSPRSAIARDRGRGALSLFTGVSARQVEYNIFYPRKSRTGRIEPKPREAFKVSPLLHIHCLINHVHRGQGLGAKAERRNGRKGEKRPLRKGIILIKKTSLG